MLIYFQQTVWYFIAEGSVYITPYKLVISADYHREVKMALL